LCIAKIKNIGIGLPITEEPSKFSHNTTQIALTAGFVGLVKLKKAFKRRARW